MKKRIFSLLTALCLLLSICSTAAVAVEPHGFSDVTSGSWYEEAAAYCQENGWMNGTSAATFTPNGTMTRSMLATVLYRQAGSPAATGSDSFTDTADGTWYSSAVLWASQENIVNGYGNGLFGVNDPVTREQLVTILWRMAGSPAVEQGVPFADQNSISSYALSAVSWAKARKIINGKNDNRFDPKGNATRAEVAVVLMNHDQATRPAPAPTPEPTASPVPTTAPASRPFGGSSGGSSGGGSTTPTPTPTPTSTPTPAPTGSRVLVTYFSATNTTKPLAEYAADLLDADLYKIVPEVPYTSDDLAYYTGGRADQEQNDPNARPGINGTVNNMDGYDIVFIGYPIWHGQPPRIISTFMESYDFAGKTIVPFCTSHSSGYSDSTIKPLAADADWLTGRRFPGGTSRSTIEEWINGLDLPKAEEDNAVGVFDFENKRVQLNSGYTMPINGLGTYSLHGETCVNAVKSALAQGVRLIDTAHMYGNEEEIGQAIRESMEELGIKREEIFVITKIYPGSDMANPEAAIQGCLDRLNIGYVDMMLLHHPDTNDVKAYKAMEKFVGSGQIRSLGLSNWYVSELTSFLPQVTITPALVQNEIHPYYQENDVIPFIQEKGIVVQGWYPLGGRGHTAELLGNETISAIAAAHGVSFAQVILRWNLQKGVVVIPGSSNPDHIKENTELYHFELTDEEMAQINALDRGEKHDWY